MWVKPQEVFIKTALWYRLIFSRLQFCLQYNLVLNGHVLTYFMYAIGIAMTQACISSYNGEKAMESLKVYLHYLWVLQTALWTQNRLRTEYYIRLQTLKCTMVMLLYYLGMLWLRICKMYCYKILIRTCNICCFSHSYSSDRGRNTPGLAVAVRKCLSNITFLRHRG